MTTMTDPLVESAIPTRMTVRQLRNLLADFAALADVADQADLADEAAVRVGVDSQEHFNHLLGTMPVTAARMTPSPDGPVLVLSVAGTS